MSNLSASSRFVHILQHQKGTQNQNQLFSFVLINLSNGFKELAVKDLEMMHFAPAQEKCPAFFGLVTHVVNVFHSSPNYVQTTNSSVNFAYVRNGS